MGDYPFTDPASGRECSLTVPPDGRVFPGPGEPKIGVIHPGCDQTADLAIELDAFWCPACRWNGRVSGAWAADVMNAIRTGRTVPRDG